MVSYSTNWMGPINLKWIEEHGECWSAGRIDIYGISDEDYRLEYGLPAMHTEDWNDFSSWLSDFETHELWEFDDIIAQYEQESGRKIRWASQKRVQCSRCGGINQHSAECDIE